MDLLRGRRKRADDINRDEDVNSPEQYLKRDGFEDCASCRVFGSTAFVALGGYTYFSGMKSLRERQRAIAMSKSRYKYGSRQLGILSLSATLVGLGIYRMFN